MTSIVEAKDFVGDDAEELLDGVEEFSECLFRDVDFSSKDLRGVDFVDCEFESCNLSSAIIEKTGFKSCRFTDSKMMGLRFDTVNTFLLEMAFSKCNLSMSIFSGLQLKETNFDHCDLTSCDFVEANLEAALFEGSNLAGALFESTNLKMASFRHAYNFSINPSLNNIAKARFSRDSIEGLLGDFNIILE